MTLVSYAQNYEDVMLLRALGGVGRGFYVDVGAQDPVEDSVTKAFYERGWRGVNIEPVECWYERLREDRPRDVNLRMLASAREGTADFYEVAGTGLSTMDAKLADQHARDGREVVRHRIACGTLDHVLETCGEETIHFLKIDVEGAEAQVLAGLSLDRHRPWVLLIEARAPNSDIETHAEWEPGVVSAGYVLAYQDGLNRFYVASERREALASAFASPPNVLDDFIRHGEWRVRNELALLQVASEDQLRRISILEATVQQGDAQIGQWSDRAAGIAAQAETLQSRLDAAGAERTSLLARLADLDNRLEATQQLADGRQREIVARAGLQADLERALQDAAMRDWPSLSASCRMPRTPLRPAMRGWPSNRRSSCRRTWNRRSSPRSCNVRRAIWPASWPVGHGV